ncbi:MAG: SagB/ThcOx family dehydrogenase [Kiritimatiellia bacterium]
MKIYTAGIALAMCMASAGMAEEEGGGNTVKLPEPDKKGKVSLEETLAARRSRREYAEGPLSLKQAGQILWAAQGITGEGGRKKTAPSAGATYPMKIYLAAGKDGVKGLDAGVYRYVPDKHEIEMVKGGDVQSRLALAALGQQFVASAPVNIVIAAEYARTTRRYGERGKRYVHMEAGHISENIYLQAEAAGLGTVAVGAFDDEKAADLLGLPNDLAPMYIMPVGKR